MSIKLLGNLKKGLLFVISAPAGTGKSTLVDMLVKEFPDVIFESCSSTTRSRRLGEVNDQHYQFLSEKEFEAKVQMGEFLEHAKVFDNYYGTRKDEVERLQNEGKHVFLVIDTQGALKLKKKVSATFIFISPPSFEELQRRLMRRKTEDEKAIENRLSWAKEELKYAQQYDYHIINDDLAVSYQILRSIVIAKEHENLKHTIDFFRS